MKTHRQENATGTSKEESLTIKDVSPFLSLQHSSWKIAIIVNMQY